jgi:hypothetical protein
MAPSRWVGHVRLRDDWPTEARVRTQRVGSCRGRARGFHAHPRACGPPGREPQRPSLRPRRLPRGKRGDRRERRRAGVGVETKTRRWFTVALHCRPLGKREATDRSERLASASSPGRACGSAPRVTGAPVVPKIWRGAGGLGPAGSLQKSPRCWLMPPPPALSSNPDWTAVHRRALLKLAPERSASRWPRISRAAIANRHALRHRARRRPALLTMRVQCLPAAAVTRVGHERVQTVARHSPAVATLEPLQTRRLGF